MRKLYILMATLLMVANLWAQSPQKMTYQAIIRDANSQLITNKSIGIRVSILQGSSNGTIVYNQALTTTTNINGLITIELGETVDFNAINWSNGPYFIKTEVDPSGGINYSITGTSQLLSVPYALHAKTAEGLSGAISETDPVFSSWDKSTGVTINASQVSNLSPVATSGDYTDLTNTPQGTAIGQIQYWNGANWINLDAGTNGQVLAIINDIPQWVEDNIQVGTAIGQIQYWNGNNWINLDAGTNGQVLTIFNNTPQWVASNTPQGTTFGQLLHWNGTSWAILDAGTEGQILTMKNGTPQWGSYSPGLAQVETIEVNQIGATNAFVVAEVLSEGGNAVSERGILWGNSPNLNINDANKIINGYSSGSYTTQITELTMGVTYYTKAYAINTAGTAYGSELNFTTHNIPSVEVSHENITNNSVFAKGIIVSNGGAAITSKGFVWSTSENPTIDSNLGISTNGTGDEPFESSLNGLESRTTYYIRAYATNSIGVNYSDQLSVITLPKDGDTDIITDIENNTYKTVFIGSQWWMAENLRTTKYNDGTPIPILDAQTTISPDEFYSWYDYDRETYGNDYGAYYSKYTVATKKLCPIGWKVPSNEDWILLTNHVGGTDIAGDKLKSKRSVPDAHPRWDYSNPNVTDEYGFSALPSGFSMYEIPNMGGIGTNALWYTSDIDIEFNNDIEGIPARFEVISIIRRIMIDQPNVGYVLDSINFGASVRCIKE